MTHYPTMHLRFVMGTEPYLIERLQDGSTVNGLRPLRILQQLWHPIIAGQGRESEWRDVPVIEEPKEPS